MTSKETLSRPAAFAFGAFVLRGAEQVLLEHGLPVRLGGRAFDLLLTLVEKSGEVISREQIEARVWPRTIVEETSLRVHVSTLRRVLKDGRDGARLIATIPGRGYCFVAPVTPLFDDERGRPNGPIEYSAPHDPLPGLARSKLPLRLTRMIGRSEAVAAITAQLATRRLLSIVGAGGMGKTTVALAVAGAQFSAHSDGVHFVDLAPLSDPARVPAAVAQVVGVNDPSGNPWPALEAFLRESSMLIVLDNCEHVIHAAAELAERVLKSAPNVRILATSREALEAEGEWVHRLAALCVPAVTETLTVDEALRQSAVQLFVERAAATASDFSLTPANLHVVCALCRRLDGMPLAIELAAGRVHELGLEGVANRLSDMFSVLTRGRRTALPRHRTLLALLEWSHALLTESERAVLRRLSVFRAGFSLDSASSVAACDHIGAADVVDCILSLTGKSLVASDATDDDHRHRLLYTTRAYASDRLDGSGERRAIRTRHAEHLCNVLEKAIVERDKMPITEWLARHSRVMDDVRAALDWASSDDGEPVVAVSLTVAALDLVYELGLLDEYRARVDVALEIVHKLAPEQPAAELRLRAARSFLGPMTRGERYSTAENAGRAIELAGRVDSPRHQAEVLFGLCSDAFGQGDYPATAALADRVGAIAKDPDDPMSVLLADRFRALSGHYLGDHARASRLAQRVLVYPAGHAYRQYIGHIPRAVSMRILRARILWLEGRSDQAADLADEAVQHATGENPLALSQALAMATVPIALWSGDHAKAGASIDQLTRQSARYSQAYWQSWATSYRNILSSRLAREAGDVAGTGPLVPATLAAEADMLGTLAEEAATPRCVARVEAGTVGWCAPEILRAAAENSLRGSDSSARVEAEALLLRSLEMARSQAALAWELRSAMSLARLLRLQGRIVEARAPLAAAYEGFTEGFGTRDLRDARALLDELVD